MAVTTTTIKDRVISLGPGLPAIPERLLLAHARGHVLFLAGAGVSLPAGLPDFRKLVLDVYEKLDAATHAVMKDVPRGACNKWAAATASLTSAQAAEVQRFVAGEYDVVLGFLERRMDGRSSASSQVRTEVANAIRKTGVKPAPIHRALMRLAQRGAATTIATTNFDRLLEGAAKAIKRPVESYSL